MDAASLSQEIQLAALAVGLGLGTLAVAATCYVWFRHQTYGVGGAGMSVLGLALLGLSLWQSLEISMSDKGVAFKAALATEQLTKRAGDYTEQGVASTEALRKRVDKLDASIKQIAQRSTPPTQADIAALAQNAQLAHQSAVQAVERWRILQDTQAKIMDIQRDVASKAGPQDETYKKWEEYVRGS